MDKTVREAIVGHSAGLLNTMADDLGSAITDLQKNPSIHDALITAVVKAGIAAEKALHEIADIKRKMG